MVTGENTIPSGGAKSNMRDQKFSTFIDHFDILSVEWDKATEAIMNCGFVNDYGTNEVPPFHPESIPDRKFSTADIIKTQFLFSNCYMISTHARSKEDGLYHCYGNYDPAHPGMFHLGFGSHDIERCYDNVLKTDLKLQYEDDFQGYIGWSGRFCNGATLKGQGVVGGLIFEGTYDDICFFVNNHKTAYLLYNPGQYRHINGVTSIDEIILCVEDNAAFKKMSRDIPIITQCIEHASLDTGIRSLRLMDSEAIQHCYGISPDPKYKGQMGLVFTVPDFTSLDFVLNTHKMKYTALENRRVVDILDETGAFLVFQRKP